MITCQECGAEFQVTHEEMSDPEYCPFCSHKLLYNDLETNEDWEDSGDGC